MEDTYKGSITLASVEDGRDESEQIIVQSSDETIYKFYTSEGFKQYSPESVAFWVQQRGETYGEEVSGDVISFETDIAAPLDSAKVTLTPKQDLNGYDKPWPAGGGKNKLDPSTITLSKMTFADGIYSASDGDTRDPLILKLQHYNGNSLIRTDTIGTVTEPGEYVVMGPIPEGTTRLRFANNGTTSEFSMNFPLPSSVPEFSIVTFYIEVVDATVGASKYKNPMLVFGDLSGGYEPYSNVCPITGTEEVTVTKVGKNLLPRMASGTKTDNGVTFVVNDDGSVTMNGTATANSSLRYTLNAPVKLDGEYIVNGINGGSSTTWRFQYKTVDKDGTVSGWIYVNQNEQRRTFNGVESISDFRVVVLNGTTVDNVTVYPMIRRADDTDPTYEPYNGETVTTDLGRTVYGGTVDVVNGELVVDRAMVTYDGSENWYTGAISGGTRYRVALDGLPTGIKYVTNIDEIPNCVANLLPVVSAITTWSENDGIAMQTTYGWRIYCHMFNTSDVTPWKAFLSEHPLTICYELATPITYHLTPQQVNALLGTNTIWSDAGQIDIIYPKKDGTIVRPTSNLIPDVDYDHELELVGTSVEDYKNLWSFFSRINGTLNADETTQSASVLNLVRTISNNQVIFNIDNLNNLAIDEGTSQADKDLFDNLQSQLSGSNYFFNFKVYKPTNNDPPLAIDLIDYKPIGVEFGTSDDMAQFSLTATNIQQLVRDTKLTFDAQGLHLENGAFDITDTRYHLASPSVEEFDANKTSYYTYDTETGKYIQCTSSSTYNASTQYYTSDPLELLAYDPNLHTLRVNGNGKFTGTIEATDGSFTGHVVATSGSFTGTVAAQEGEIGGWVIRNDGLYSRATGDNKPSIELLSEGTINAQTINLGTGAHINDFIQLGENAVLYNPDEHTRKVLSLGNPESISLYNNGLFQLGNITLDGENSIIKGNNWSIDPDFARFRNVEISGKISSAVFETASVSAVGGIMLFKTAYKVESFSGRNIVLDIKYSGNVGDSVYLTNSDGQLSELMTVDAINEKQVMLAEAIPFTEVISLIQIGNINNRPIIIGVNSTDVNAGFLSYQGITISEVYKEGNNIKNDIKAFLGNLQSLNIQGVTGYGLYGSNVYLTGSLTTQVQGLTTSYAGINTLNGANATKFDNDTSKIVFWAGSEGITNEQIAAAPFQVTENGSIYASRGIFEGSIISRSTIEGSVIKTARIEGSGTNPALKILDAINGIGFYTVGANDQDIEAFTIGSDGFKIGNNHFISISNNSIDFNGRNITIDSLYTRNVGGITLAISRNKIESKYGNVTTPSITFKTNSIDLTVQSTDSKFSVTESLTSLNTDLVEMKKNIAYGNIMKYERVENQNGNENGYDLYVY